MKTAIAVGLLAFGVKGARSGGPKTRTGLHGALKGREATAHDKHT